MQIYFTGGSKEQVDRRCSIFSNLRRDIVQRSNSSGCWMGSTDTCRTSRHGIERLSNAGPDDHCHVIIRGDRVPAGEHPGRYSLPTSNEEVGAVITGNQLGNRDIA
eukprot:33682-Hanusia_phi.AAC.1